MAVASLALKSTILAAAFTATVIAFPAVLSAKPKHVTTFHLPKGAKVQKLSNGRFRVLGVSGTFNCSCTSDSGSCSTRQTEGTFECGVSGDTCKGTCTMTTTTTGGKLQMR